MTINEQNSKYEEVIINNEKKKREMLDTINNNYNCFLKSNGKDKRYYLANIMQILILLEKINEKVKDVELSIKLNDIRNKFRSEYFIDIDIYKIIVGLVDFKTQYMIELYKLMAMDDMYSLEYEEQVKLVKKYKSQMLKK